MIIDARRLPHGQTIDCDICIVGGGAAGVTLALELADGCAKVVLLESGGMKVSPQTQSLDAGEVVDRVRHAPSNLFRQRRLGGTTNVWGGRCAPFDELDFEARDHVPYSGWPLSKTELDGCYGRAQTYLELGDYAYNVASALPMGTPPMISGFHSQVFSAEKLWRYSAANNVTKKWIKSLKQQRNVAVYLHATCLNLTTNHDGSCIDHLTVASLGRNEFSIRAKQYVLAAGGLETPRILLTSKNDAHPKGLGNDRGLVGRFYMSHLHGLVGTVGMTPEHRPIKLDLEMCNDGVYCRRMLSVVEEKRRSYRLQNFSAFLSHPLQENPAHKNGILSARYFKELLFPVIALKKGLRANSGVNSTSPRLALAHVRNIILDSPKLLRLYGQLMLTRAKGRRYHMPVGAKAYANGSVLTIDAEQAPNPESRVTLTDSKDEFGINRLRIDWKVTDADVQSVLTTCNLLAGELDHMKVGKLWFDPNIIPSPYVTKSMGGHHLGTTRMAKEPSLGVVNEHCRVHGMSNLYIASGSVFPTSGSANPTLTVIALTLRLADHLKRLYSGSSARPSTCTTATRTQELHRATAGPL